MSQLVNLVKRGRRDLRKRMAEILHKHWPECTVPVHFMGSISVCVYRSFAIQCSSMKKK